MTRLLKRLVLVRHGQSKMNIARLRTPVFFDTIQAKEEFAGLADQHIDLTELGFMQAKVTGEALASRGFHFDRVYDSGYVRTAKTRELLLDGYSLEPIESIRRCQDLRLRERECGYTFFMTKDQVDAQFPWLEEYWRTSGPVFARPIGGESIADVVLRVGEFLRDMFAQASGESVLISTHGRVLMAIRHILEGWTWQQLEEAVRKGGTKNCGVTVFEPSEDGSKLVLKEYNTCYWTSDAPLCESSH